MLFVTCIAMKILSKNFSVKQKSLNLEIFNLQKF